MKHALVGAVATAAVSTLGDYLWKNVLPHGQPVYWFAHAIVLFATIGLCLGWPSRKPMTGAIGAVLVGCAATLGFYFLRRLLGYSAILVLFTALWVALGLLTGRVLQRRARMGEILTRSVLAAVGSGLGFYAISGIWIPFDPQGWDYAVHFVSWIVAYLPAFAALLAGRPRT
jgi:hypothetical protein